LDARVINRSQLFIANISLSLIQTASSIYNLWITCFQVVQRYNLINNMNEDIQPTNYKSLDAVWRDTSKSITDYFRSLRDGQGQCVNDGVVGSLFDKNVEGWISGESTELGEGGNYVHEDVSDNQSGAGVLDGCINKPNEVEGVSNIEE
jgi:hypothetical protein